MTGRRHRARNPESPGALLTTIVSVTRNWSDLPFSWCATPVQRRRVQERIRLAMARGSRRARSAGPAGPWLLPAASLTVTAPDDDHVRIRAERPGLAIRRALRATDDVVRWLGDRAPLARHEDWGWLAASPADAGHGLRVLFRLRCPALAAAGYGREALGRLTASGLAVGAPAPEAPPDGRETAWLLTHREPLGARPLAWLARPARAIAAVLTLERAVAGQLPAAARGGGGGMAGIPRPR